MSKEKQDKHKALLGALTNKQIQKLNTKIVEGTSVSVLTKLVREEFGAHKDVKYITIYQRMSRYVTFLKRHHKEETEIKSVTPEQVATYVQNYNALERLTSLCKVQESRIEKAMKLEEGKPLLVKQASDEIKNLSFMLKDLADIQVKAGVIVQAPGGVS